MAVTPTNRPFWEIRSRKAGPAACRHRRGDPHRHGDQDRDGRQRAQHGPGPAAAEQHPELGRQQAAGQGPAPDRRARAAVPASAVRPLRWVRGAGADGARRRTPADDLLLDNVEPLPRQRHKPVLQADLFGREAADPDPRRHQGGHHGFRCHGRAAPRTGASASAGLRSRRRSAEPPAVARTGPRRSRSRRHRLAPPGSPSGPASRSGPAGPAPAPRYPGPASAPGSSPGRPGAVPPGSPAPPAGPRS